jgi:hypothetical protein
MPGRGSLGVQAERSSGSAPIDADAVAVRVSGEGAIALLCGSLPISRHDLRYCTQPRRCLPFLRPAGCSERRGSWDPPSPTAFPRPFLPPPCSA